MPKVWESLFKRLMRLRTKHKGHAVDVTLLFYEDGSVGWIVKDGQAVKIEG